MPYHFGNNEYEHLIGGTVGNVVIKNIEFRPDKIYMGTDGYAGNPYVLTLYLKKPEMRVFPSKVGTFHNIIRPCIECVITHLKYMNYCIGKGLCKELQVIMY